MPSTPWPARYWPPLLWGLTFATLALHGFHPLAEDGGLYVAGIKSLLHPELYPHTLPFVREHLRFSLFAPMVADIVRCTHLPLLWTLLTLYLLSIAGTLLAVRMILRQLGFADGAALLGTATIAACWTMPVAATSLMLMDPYVTARSLTTPLTLAAFAWSLTPNRRNAVRAAIALLLATALHPLMAFYGCALIVAVAITRAKHPVRNWLATVSVVVVAACVLQNFAAPESHAETLAAFSRYYWFLSQWHWYECLGLLGPVLIFALLARKCSPPRRVVLQALILVAGLSVMVTLAFAQEHFAAHPIARLQPLRIFLELYVLMLAIGAASLAEGASSASRASIRHLPWLVPAAAAVAFFCVARQTYTTSPQIEFPWKTNNNPWVQAFVWARENTPVDATFALDGHYVNRDGEDAQTFRAVAERDAIPDGSKDGGEAAITPSLADAWLAGATAQQDMDVLNDKARDSRLAPFSVDYVVLNAGTATAHPCPYRNAVVKVCRMR